VVDGWGGPAPLEIVGKPEFAKSEDTKMGKLEAPFEQAKIGRLEKEGGTGL